MMWLMRLGWRRWIYRCHRAVGDEGKYLRVRAALESRDGAVEAYARFGDRIFNPDGSLVDDLVEFGSATTTASFLNLRSLYARSEVQRIGSG